MFLNYETLSKVHLLQNLAERGGASRGIRKQGGYPCFAKDVPRKEFCNSKFIYVLWFPVSTANSYRRACLGYTSSNGV